MKTPSNLIELPGGTTIVAADVMCVVPYETCVSIVCRGPSEVEFTPTTDTPAEEIAEFVAYVNACMHLANSQPTSEDRAWVAVAKAAKSVADAVDRVATEVHRTTIAWSPHMSGTGGRASPLAVIAKAIKDGLAGRDS